jgi:uncharacterized membrane protein YeaQ/YmgE (transglycosylase-associated protein family)
MLILSAIVTGTIVGVLAELVMPGRHPGGIAATVPLGIAGGAAAGLFGQTMGWYSPGFTEPGTLASTVGALLLLVAYGWMTGRPRRA